VSLTHVFIHLLIFCLPNDANRYLRVNHDMHISIEIRYGRQIIKKINYKRRVKAVGLFNNLLGYNTAAWYIWYKKLHYHLY